VSAGALGLRPGGGGAGAPPLYCARGHTRGEGTRQRAASPGAGTLAARGWGRSSAPVCASRAVAPGDGPVSPGGDATGGGRVPRGGGCNALGASGWGSGMRPRGERTRRVLSSPRPGPGRVAG
jgi:hypothetical protein